VYKIKYSTSEVPSLTHFAPCTLGFQKAIAEATDGKVEMEIFHSGQLADTKGTLDIIRSGVADLGSIGPGYHPGFFPLEDGFRLPPKGINTSEQATQAAHAAFKAGFFDKEHEALGIRYLGNRQLRPYIAFTIKTPIRNMADFKGKIVKSSQRPFTMVMEAWDAIVIASVYAESYENLQKGVLEVMTCGIDDLVSYKWYELGKPGYVIDVGGLVTGMGEYIMNLESLNSLPADCQKAVIDTGEVYWMQVHGWTKDWEAKFAEDVLKDFGCEFIVFSDEEKAKYEASKDPVRERFVSDATEKGFPEAAELMEFIVEQRDDIVDRYPVRTEWPELYDIMPETRWWKKYEPDRY
jgi:TRAP-type C4-dicarboxylate transport system substrate-binding protein